jgi:hypothetical protein
MVGRSRPAPRGSTDQVPQSLRLPSYSFRLKSKQGSCQAGLDFDDLSASRESAVE